MYQVPTETGIEFRTAGTESRILRDAVDQQRLAQDLTPQAALPPVQAGGKWRWHAPPCELPLAPTQLPVLANALENYAQTGRK